MTAHAMVGIASVPTLVHTKHTFPSFPPSALSIDLQEERVRVCVCANKPHTLALTINAHTVFDHQCVCVCNKPHTLALTNAHTASLRPPAHKSPSRLYTKDS